MGRPPTLAASCPHTHPTHTQLPAPSPPTPLTHPHACSFLPTLDGRHLLFGSDQEAMRRQFIQFFSREDWDAHVRLQDELAQLRDDVAPTWLQARAWVGGRVGGWVRGLGQPPAARLRPPAPSAPTHPLCTHLRCPLPLHPPTCTHPPGPPICGGHCRALRAPRAAPGICGFVSRTRLCLPLALWLPLRAAHSHVRCARSLVCVEREGQGGTMLACLVLWPAPAGSSPPRPPAHPATTPTRPPARPPRPACMHGCMQVRRD